MEIVGSVASEEVPAGRRPRNTRVGIWPPVVARAITDHEQGRVTVIKVKDQKEYNRLRNGTALLFRKTKYRLHPVVVEGTDGWRIFLELRLKDMENGAS